MNLQQRLIFARYIPPAQLARRIYMRVKRKLADKLLSAPPPPLYSIPPKALTLPHLHSPRGLMKKIEGGWETRFVGFSRKMGETVDWDLRANDAKAQLWRMNLHYFEYLPDMTPEIAQPLITDWIQRCRPRNPTSSSAGWTPYAISLRISAWLDFWAINGPFGDADFQSLFSGSLREQTDYLMANLETDVKGNHLFKNIRALEEMGAAYEDSDAKKWSAAAKKHLKRELKVQILPCGFHFERSASYHAQVFADLLTMKTVRDDDELTEDINSALFKMACALRDLSHPDELPIQFNDSGLTMCIAPMTALKAYSKSAGTQNFKIEDPNQGGVFSYPESGFYGRKTKADYFVVKMGPLGPDALMAHAHGDWGSFEYSLNQQRIFVDQGVFEYINGPDRRLCRSTLAHNTATLDDAEQADFFGAFRCASRPHPAPVEFTPTKEGFSLAGTIRPCGHDKALELSRTLHTANDGFDIHDKSERPTAVVTSRLLLHPHIKAVIEKNIVTLYDTANSREKSLAELRCGGDQEFSLAPAEWFPNMGERLPTTRILLTGSGETRLRFIRSPM